MRALYDVNSANLLTDGAQEHNDQEQTLVLGEAAAEVVRGDHDAEEAGDIEEQGDTLKVLEAIAAHLDDIFQTLAHINLVCDEECSRDQPKDEALILEDLLQVIFQAEFIVRLLLRLTQGWCMLRSFLEEE